MGGLGVCAESGRVCFALGYIFMGRRGVRDWGRPRTGNSGYDGGVFRRWERDERSNHCVGAWAAGELYTEHCRS